MPYLRQRLAEGERYATRLWREITSLGFAGQVMTVRACAAALKEGEPASTTPASAPVWRRPTPRRAARELLSAAESAGMDGRFYAALIDAVPEIGRAVEEARGFAALVRERDRDALDPWLERARDGPLRGFAERLRRDRAAVEAALTLPWSTSPVEGQITRLKLIKRQGYGRAGLDLLRARVLTA